MTSCPLCMTELDPEAVVCKGCGASKRMVRQEMGHAKKGMMLGFVCVALLFMFAGWYLVGFGCLAIAVGISKAQPSQLMWIRSTIVAR